MIVVHLGFEEWISIGGALACAWDVRDADWTKGSRRKRDRSKTRMPFIMFFKLMLIYI
jgi:hypothetical protein